MAWGNFLGIVDMAIHHDKQGQHLGRFYEG